MKIIAYHTENRTYNSLFDYVTKNEFKSFHDYVSVTTDDPEQDTFVFPYKTILDDVKAYYKKHEAFWSLGFKNAYKYGQSQDEQYGGAHYFLNAWFRMSQAAPDKVEKELIKKINKWYEEKELKPQERLMVL